MIKNKKKWDLDRHKEASPQFKAGIDHHDKKHKQNHNLAIFLCLIGIIAGLIIGFFYGQHFIIKGAEYQDFLTTQKKVDLQPNVTILTDRVRQVENGYERRSLGIQTSPTQKIDKLIISYDIKGNAAQVKPGNYLGWKPSCIPDIRPVNANAAIINGKAYATEVFSEKITFTCSEVLPGSHFYLNVEYKPRTKQYHYDERMSIEYFWLFEGNTERESYIKYSNGTIIKRN